MGLLAWLSAWAGTPAAAAESASARPEVVRATLTNGLQVIIVQNPLAPVVTTVVNYRVGSDEAPPGFPGTAHALEHMMFRGSPQLTGDQLSLITADLGGDFNADTQQPVTQYFFTVPAEDLDLALRIEALRMQGIAKDDTLWDQERGAIEQEVAQDLSNPEYALYMRVLEWMFQDTPYAHDALGTRPSFDKTTASMLRHFHADWYVPNNAVLVIVGNVDPGQALERVRSYFGTIPSRPLPPRPSFEFKPLKPRTLTLESDLPYGLTTLAFRWPGYSDPDYAAAQILADALGSQRGNLYALVPEGKALLTSFSYDTLPRSGLGYATAAFPAGGDAKKVDGALRRILGAESTNGIPPELVEAAKRREIANEEFQKNSVFGLAMEWSQAVAIEGRQSPQDDIDAIRRVTPADVNRVARSLLDLDQALTATLVPQPSGKPVSTKSFGGTESLSHAPAKAVTLPAWAEQAVTRLDVPASTLHPDVTYLSNGIRLIVQPETVSDSVSVYGRIRNKPKVEMPQGRDGVDEMLDRLFSFGTKSLGRLEFQKALDDIAATESAGVDFSLQVLAGDFDRGVALLAENEISPALPGPAFDILKPELAAASAGELRSPGYHATRALETSLFPKSDPVQRETTPATIQSLTMGDVAAYYHYAFRPDLTTIVVIGKVTPEKAREVIGKYFGSWSSKGPKPDTLYPPAPTNAPTAIDVADPSRVQDRVVLAETLELTRTNPDYYPLQLGNHVLGGAFYATRLYRDLRKETGLVYFVSSAFEMGLTRGVYQVSYACDPPNVYKARAIVADDLEQMRSTDVSPGELRQAKVLLLREIPLSESSVERIAQGWLSRSDLDLPLDEPVRAAHRYVLLQAGDVRAAFAKWLRPKDFVQVNQGPPPRR